MNNKESAANFVLNAMWRSTSGKPYDNCLGCLAEDVANLRAAMGSRTRHDW